MTGSSLAERMEATTAARAQGEGKTLYAELEDPKFKREIAKALPRLVDADRFLRLALTATRSTPKLLQCSRASFLGAVMSAAQLGLEPDVRGLAYLIPRWNGKTQSNEATLLIGYKGYLDLARRSGVDVSAEVVYEGDDFDFELGTGAFLRHKPLMVGERGEVIAAYAVANNRFMVLRRDEIERRRGRGQSKTGPWDTDWDAMARKTAVRAFSAYLPQTVELAQAAALDETVRTDYLSPLEDVQVEYEDAELVEVTAGESESPVESEAGDTDSGDASGVLHDVSTSPASTIDGVPEEGSPPRPSSGPVDFNEWLKEDLVRWLEGYKALPPRGAQKSQKDLAKLAFDVNAALEAPFSA